MTGHDSTCQRGSKNAQKSGLTYQDLSSLPAAVYLAQEVGEGVGKGYLL